jgi:hypothetical protein
MDATAFISAQLTPRTEFVAVPELAPFFEPAIEAAVSAHLEETEADEISKADRDRIIRNVCGFKVRGLTGTEFGKAKKQAQERRNFVAIAEGLFSATPKKIINALKDLYGASDMSEEDALNIYMLMDGIVEPEFQADQKLQVIRKLYDAYPIDFQHIARRILLLTGLGHVPGKPPASTGKTA